MPTTPFNPSPETLDQILDQLADPECSLREIAEIHKTTLAALTLFMTRPDIAEAIATLQSGAATKARLAAADSLPTVITALKLSVESFLFESCHALIRVNSLAAMEQRRKARETARKAAFLIFRIATFDPARPRARTPAPNPILTPPPPSLTTPSPRRRQPTLEDLAPYLSDLPIPACTPTLASAAAPPPPPPPPPTKAPSPTTAPAPTPHHPLTSSHHAPVPSHLYTPHPPPPANTT